MMKTEPFTTCSPRPLFLLWSRRRVAPAVAVMIAVLIWAGLADPVSGGPRKATPRYDRQVLSEIADDVLRRAAARPDRSVPESVSTRDAAEDEATADEDALHPEGPVTHIAPAREGITVEIPPGSAAATKAIAEDIDTGYHSNSWRQRPGTARGLSFSSGVLAPGSGLDPALKAQAEGPGARGRQFVYGFLLLRAPLDEVLEQTLGALGVKLLGPHDDTHKARLPVGSLEAVAALPEVEWVGVSTREQKRSRELSELRGNRATAAGIESATPIPIVINLFEGDEDGTLRQELEAAGVAIGEYDADLHFYRAVATGPTIDNIVGLDFVQFVDLIGLIVDDHDQSMALVDADMIRPGTSLGLTRFSGASTLVGILDGGFMMGPTAPVMHGDLSKAACGQNFTNESGGAFNDLKGHGTHVIATITGTGTGNPRFRGVAPGVGSVEEIRAAKVTDSSGTGDPAWAQAAMDFMSSFSGCVSAPPDVINISNGQPGTGFTGTDDLSRKLDDKVWNYGQVYVVSAGNGGSNPQTIGRPGVAKNALTVGSVFDRQYLGVGDITQSSSRGPTGDGRMKPNLVAPGNIITSAQAGTTTGYTDKNGTSHATPHVTGLVATLMEHYPQFKGRPAFLRSHLMATAIAHDDATGMSNDYGLGRVSGFLAHWAHPNSDGWSTNWFYGGVNSFGFAYGDVTVPVGTQRLVVVLTWDEPAASAGASQAVTYNLDLWADHNVDCGDPSGACGEYASRSTVDNVEYLVINNPPAGSYRLKIVPANAPTFQLRYGMTAVIIRGDPTPAMTAYLTPPATSPLVGSIFQVKMAVGTPAYVASGVQVRPSLIPSGVTLLSVQTTRHDGVTMVFPDTADTLTLGNVVPTHSRLATYFLRADTAGPKTFFVRAWSENGGDVVASTSFEVATLGVDLIETAMGTSPATPIAAPGGTFTVTDTVLNSGPGTSASSTARYYLSLDAVKSADDTLLAGSHSVSALDAGASHTATVTVTIPAATPLDSYFLLACADHANTVVESDEGNNCIASPGAIVTVGRADLVESTAATIPSAPVRAPGKTFSVTDTVQNIGSAPSGSSTTRYYLSLDGVKSANDTLLTGGRSVSGLAPGATHSGTVTVTIPGTTPLNTYFLLTCADKANTVVESNEDNNCIASPAATVTVGRPDLVENTVSNPPATRARSTAFAVTDAAQNLGALEAGPSRTRYYLSVDTVKGAGDTLLTGYRAVPGLAAGATNSGTVTVTIPGTTPLDTYFLLACADNGNTVVESDENNNCHASSTKVTITP